jgi:uncharacterized membrane protein
MKKISFILILAVFLFSWELKRNENGIKVYTQSVENSKYDEFKAETCIKAPFDKVEKFLLDFKNYPKWQKKIEEIDVKNGYMFKRLDFPFPLSDRYAFYKINVKKTSDSLEIDLKSVPYADLPENIKKLFKKPSCVEMKDDVTLKAEKKDGCVDVVYKANVNPNGAPAFIFNQKIVTAGYETLENLKNLIQ